MIRAIAPAAVLAGLVAGCFGTGPVPSKPDRATVVFAAPIPDASERCTAAVYIGSVAFGPAVGYAILLPYSPNNCGGSGPQKINAPVMQFDKTGAAALGTQIGTAPAQSQGGTTPRVAATAAGAVWAYNDGTQSDITVDPGGLRTNPTNPGGFVSVTGLVSDGPSIWVAGWSPNTGSSGVDDPQFPCCGPGGGGSGTYSFTKLPGPTQVAVTPQFACETLDQCLRANAMSLFFLAHDPSNPPMIVVHAFPKSGTSSDELAQLAVIDENVVGGVPSGFAAGDTRVAWTIGPDWASHQTDTPAPVCQIFVYDLALQRVDRVLATTSFSCMGAAIDGDSIYVAIVAQAANEDCNGCTVPLHGFGIGRFTIGAGFESIAVGITDQAGGPRRVHVDGDDLYAIDPFAIAKIPKAALDGQRDFIP